MVTPTAIVGYLALFAIVGFLFVFASLLAGRFLRPKAPNVEKLEVYECGEPTIGSSFVQFDLRFYVVALLFIIFDVEVAFFFPWATVFGKSTNLMDENLAVASAPVEPGGAPQLTPAAQGVLRELGVPPSALQGPAAAIVGADRATTEKTATAAIRQTAQKLTWLSIADIGVFFAVLLVGFAYVWRRGDLDWVRAVSQERAALGSRGPPSGSDIEEPVLSA